MDLNVSCDSLNHLSRETHDERVKTTFWDTIEKVPRLEWFRLAFAHQTDRPVSAAAQGAARHDPKSSRGARCRRGLRFGRQSSWPRSASAAMLGLFSESSLDIGFSAAPENFAGAALTVLCSSPELRSW